MNMIKKTAIKSRVTESKLSTFMQTKCFYRLHPFVKHEIIFIPVEIKITFFNLTFVPPSP